jgi:hypothetical protein
MDKKTFYVWLVLLYYAYYGIYLCLDAYYVYLSILNAYEMKCVVVPWYPCYIFVILCIFTICHTILSHDYTQLLRLPKFCKIIQLSSHMPLSLNFMIINSCISLGRAPCTNFKNKSLSCLIVEKH